ncbi:hypothetical protein [Ideonella sp.]|uniref:hypothetical protein n=1 Tax=Ideonella sp. TaxID=1929293 RepID=UPI0035AFF2E4
MADLQGQASCLTLHGATPLPLALNTPISAVADFFASEPFQGRLKEIDARHKGALLLHQRIDAVLRAIGNLGQALVRRR